MNTKRLTLRFVILQSPLLSTLAIKRSLSVRLMEVLGNKTHSPPSVQKSLQNII